MDASVIPLCLSIFDWAKFRTRKGAVKLQAVLDYDGFLPVFVHVTDGKTHEVNTIAKFNFPKGSVAVFDRGYVDFSILHDLDSKGVFFLTRAKSNIVYTVKKVTWIRPMRMEF